LMFSTNIHHFILIWQETWLLWALISFYWLKLLTCSVKLLVSMVCNLIQMMYVKFSTKIPHFVKIVWNIWSMAAMFFLSNPYKIRNFCGRTHIIFRGDDQNLKSLWKEGWTDAKWWQKFTWPFASDVL
jgi:hypothetical protein